MTHFKGWVTNNPWATMFWACSIFWAVIVTVVIAWEVLK